MSFEPSSDIKFYAFLVLVAVLASGVIYSCQNLVRNPYERCQSYCEAKGDKLSGYHTTSAIPDCLCLKDVERNWQQERQIRKN